MSVTFRILPRAGLVYVRYGRVATVSASQDAFEAYAQHPDYKPGHKQFVDLSAIEEVEHSFPELIQFQARKAAAFVGKQEQTLLVYYAPTPTSLEIAKYAMRAWQGIPNVVATVHQDEALALDFLGRPETSLTALFERTNV